MGARRGSPADEPWVGRELLVAGGGPRMWSALRRRRRPRGALGRSRRTGCNVTRSFCFWPDFVPEPERLDGDVLDRFADFLDAHVETRPRDDPDLRRRPHVGRELGSGLARRTRPLPRRLARLAAGLARRRDRAPLRRATRGRRLARLERDAALRRPRLVRGDRARGRVRSCRPSGPPARRSRSRSATAPGASRSRAATTATRCATLAPLVDFVGPHSYPMQDDEVRQLLTPAFACELAGSFGKPVVLEEFGVSSDFAADDHAADYYRQVLHTTLLAGRARLARLVQRRLRRPAPRGPVPAPRLRAPLRPDRRARAGRSRRSTSSSGSRRSSRELAERGFERVAGEAAIVVPEHFERVLPFTEQVVPRRPARQPAAGLRRRARGRPAGRARARARRDLRRRAAVSPPEREGAHRPRPRPPARGLASEGATVYASVLRGQHGERQRGPWLGGRWTSSSASGTASATASSTRSRTTRSCSSSSSRSATCR